MQETKIVFSGEELHLLTDSSIWINKRTLTVKLYEMLGDIAAELKEGHGEAFSNLLHHPHPLNAKISKGENYLGKPYVILDYPNLFHKEGIFAIRTMFWFGEVLSCCFIISGKYLDTNYDKIISALANYKGNDLFFCIGPDPWEHHFEESNMKLLNGITSHDIKKHTDDYSFIKIGFKISPNNPAEWNNFISTSYKKFLRLVS